MKKVWLVYVIYQYDGYDDTKVYSSKLKACDEANRIIEEYKEEGYVSADGWNDTDFLTNMNNKDFDNFYRTRLANEDGEVEISVEMKIVQ